MQTIPQTTPGRHPGSVPTRRRHQCARPGWHPRYCSPQQLARDIAASIQARIAEGRSWSMDDYGIKGDAHMIEMVSQYLPTKTPADIDALKRQWLDDPCFCLEDTQGFEVHRAELLTFRLTHTAWATAQANAPLKCDAWQWRVTEARAAEIEAKRLIAHYLGWAGMPLESRLQEIDELAQRLVDAVMRQQ